MRKSTSREHLLARHALVSEAPRPRPCAPFDQLALIGPARSSFLISTVVSVSMPLSDAAMDAVFRATGATDQLALDAGGLPEKNRTTSANDRAISRFERSSAEIK
jgi:hypothetical protein